MSTAITPAQQQVLNEWDKCKQRLLPAVLTDTKANGHKVNAYMLENQLAPTEDNFYRAIKALMADLAWTIPPKALVRDQQNDKPIRLESPFKQENAFEQKARAGEAKAAHQKAEDAAEKAALELIDSFLPVRRGRVAYAIQTEVQTLLRKYVADEKARGASMKDVLAKVSEYVKEQYEKIDRDNERM